MQEISLKQGELSRLKEYPLGRILATESTIYYYKRDINGNSTLLKKLFLTDEARVNRKVKTIEQLQDSELSTYDELVIPEKVASVSGEKIGFTIREVTDCTNLSLFLKSKKVKDEDKLLVLKKIGKLLQKVNSQDQEFYFGDLHEANFLVDKNKNIFVVDLDSSAVNQKQPIESKYIIIDRKTHNVSKYGIDSRKRCHPNQDVDIFCYNSMILNYLASENVSRLTYEDFFDYISYLEYCGVPKEIIEIFCNHYTNKSNRSVVNYLDLIEPTCRTDYKLYKYMKK